jgi:hypothetical protein
LARRAWPIELGNQARRASRLPRGSSRTQALAPVSTTRCQHLAAALGGHTGAKAVAALAYQFARLIGPFHGSCLRSRARNGLFCPLGRPLLLGWGRAHAPPINRAALAGDCGGLYGTPLAPSNQRSSPALWHRDEVEIRRLQCLTFQRDALAAALRDLKVLSLFSNSLRSVGSADGPGTQRT